MVIPAKTLPNKAVCPILNKMNKATLITRIAENADLTIPQATEVVNTLLDTIGDTLKDGQKVNLFGFGTFTTRRRKPRTATNPKTGQPIDVPAKNVVHFKPGKALEQILNQAD